MFEISEAIFFKAVLKKKFNLPTGHKQSTLQNDNSGQSKKCAYQKQCLVCLSKTMLDIANAYG